MVLRSHPPAAASRRNRRTVPRHVSFQKASHHLAWLSIKQMVRLFTLPLLLHAIQYAKKETEIAPAYGLILHIHNVKNLYTFTMMIASYHISKSNF